ncbi:MAG: hypothetical protein LOY03_10435 [Cyclobacteriaceae bacterium]|jgi:hypothetical protein|nr:hypothetical protein [Cyclobacteriaceae bacterium]
MRLIYLGLFLSISCSACAQAIRANHAHYKGEEFLSGRWKAKDTRLSFRQYYAPYLVQDRSANRTGSYWQGLVFTRTSPGKFFASTYYYDQQGNLRETRSFFNIRRRGQFTNWKIQFSSLYKSPVFVRTF